MNFRYSLGAVALGLVVAGCGLGDSADVGDESNNQHLGTSGAGGEGAGGASHNTGGTVGSGPVHATGGATQNTGGVVGSGGATHATGGATQNTGGAVGSGGATQGTGGSTGGVACGKNTCKSDQICCSKSCGICGSRGGLCPAIACVPDPVTPVPGDGGTCVQNVACIKGTSWSTTECKCVPEGGTCTTVSDCHLTADYCGGCNCLALSKGQSAPLCSGTMVQCLIDPCQLKNVACVAGRCVAQ